LGDKNSYILLGELLVREGGEIFIKLGNILKIFLPVFLLNSVSMPGGCALWLA